MDGRQSDEPHTPRRVDSVPALPPCDFHIHNGQCYEFPPFGVPQPVPEDAVVSACAELGLETPAVPTLATRFWEHDLRPQFVDGAGKVYSRFFSHLTNADLNEMVNSDKLLSAMPSPDSDEFGSYAQYEEEVLSWGEKVHERIHDLELPEVLGGHYYRPSALEAEMVLDDNKNASELEGPVEADHGLHMWQSDLLAKEPVPEMFDSFAEYDMAMQRWAACVSNALALVPPHPSQLQELVGLKSSKPKRIMEAPKVRSGGPRALAQPIQPLLGERSRWLDMDEDERQHLQEMVNKLASDAREGMVAFRTRKEAQENERMYAPIEARPRMHGVLARAEGAPVAKELTAVRRDARLDSAMIDCARTEGVVVLLPKMQVPVSASDWLDIEAARSATLGEGQVQAQKKVHELYGSTWMDPVQSWYFPDVPQDRWDELERQLDEVMSGAAVVDIKEITQLLAIDLPLDLFARWLDESKLKAILLPLAPNKFCTELLGLWQDERDLDTFLHDQCGNDAHAGHKRGKLLCLHADIAMAARTRLRGPSLLVSRPQHEVRASLHGALLVLQRMSTNAESEERRLPMVDSTEYYHLNVRHCTVELEGDDGFVVALAGAGRLRFRVANSAAMAATRDEWVNVLRQASLLPEPTRPTPSLHNAKLAHIVVQAMMMKRRAPALVEQLKKSVDTRAFFLLCKAVEYTTAVRQPTFQSAVFEFTPDMDAAAREFFGAEITQVLREIVAMYYVARLRNHAHPHLLGDGDFVDMVSKTEVEFKILVDEKTWGLPTFIERLLEGTKSTRASVNSLSVFALHQLMVGQECEFAGQLWSATTRFVPHLLQCASHRRQQVRQCAEVLFPLLVGPRWCNLLSQYYYTGPGKGLLFDDICGFSSRVQPLKSRLVCDWLKGLLEHTTTQNTRQIQFLFSERLFYKLLAFVSTNASEYQRNALVAGEVMVAIARRCSELSLIDAKKLVFKSKDIEDLQANAVNLIVTPVDIINMAKQASPGSETHAELKPFLLKAARHLVKHPKVFAHLQSEKSDKELYKHLLNICRDGMVEEHSLNATAWMMLYQIMRDHHTANDMVKSKRLDAFFSNFHPKLCIHTNANGMYCLAKLLMLRPNEEANATVPLTEQQKKSYDETSRIIARKVIPGFVKFHMMYSNLTQSYTPAASFQSLASLYLAFQKCPPSEKLLAKMGAKEKEYLNGLRHIQDMFKGDPR